LISNKIAWPRKPRVTPLVKYLFK